MSTVWVGECGISWRASSTDLIDGHEKCLVRLRVVVADDLEVLVEDLLSLVIHPRLVRLPLELLNIVLERVGRQVAFALQETLIRHRLHDVVRVSTTRAREGSVDRRGSQGANGQQ